MAMLSLEAATGPFFGGARSTTRYVRSGSAVLLVGYKGPCPPNLLDIATRALVVTLKAPCSGKTSTEVAGLAGISSRQVDRIYARAIKRGFDPNLRPIIIKDAYLEDAPRSGRPSKQTAENQEAILKKIKLDRANCVAYLKEGRLPEDEADEEAWSDTEDEG
ncbi:hypothetical protein LMH87_000800 [Akanthomyces muscarius]|uniref:Uncharacterized protein n=1 Tax=Akanthomyces muscarius TaxID=2231603 RepID=A0A9W8QG24_AKAMU|nr:hypothetical protein LMH87_000800 [Akanthomyces muscarius]KAJ4155561.1 hypothetical protein LMH87_000800 [Akanthomyces muscarius]